MPWDVKTRGGVALRTAYSGDSEVAFEITADGRLFVVTPHQDGDATGAGGQGLAQRA